MGGVGVGVDAFGCVCAWAIRACRSGKQGGSAGASSVGFGGAVGGRVGELEFWKGCGGLVGLVEVSGVISLVGFPVGPSSGGEGGCGCSMSYERDLTS